MTQLLRGHIIQNAELPVLVSEQKCWSRGVMWQLLRGGATTSFKLDEKMTSH
jgi:hypothetical protein